MKYSSRITLILIPSISIISGRFAAVSYTHLVTQEEEDNDDYKYKSLIYSGLNLIDRRTDKLGIIKTIIICLLYTSIFPTPDLRNRLR